MKFAILPAAGLGDALLVQIVARHLSSLGHQTTTFSTPLVELEEWFPGMTIRSSLKELDSFDAIFLQHDNSPRAKKILSLPKPVYALFGAHVPEKHGPWREGLDYQCNRTLPMAQNMKLAAAQFFPGVAPSTYNGWVPLPHLKHRHFAKRIAIHPLSTSPQKNWRKTGFLRLRDRLASEGWDPVFIVPPEESENWENSPQFSTLSELAAFLYESAALVGNDSGPGHLASNLGLPTVILGPSRSHLDFWRPSWKEGRICAPPFWISQLSWCRRRWPLFLSVPHVLQEFKKIFIDR